MARQNIIALGVILFGIATLCSGQGYGGSSPCSNDNLPTTIRVFGVPDTTGQSAGLPNSGFFVDLLNAIKQQTGLAYSLTAHPELVYGSAPDASGSWKGSLIGALINNDADLVGPDITLTSVREAVVDFLVPITEYDLQILANAQHGIANGVQYVIQDTADLTYLKNSQNATLQAIYANIQAGKPGSIVSTAADGLAKVLSGNFAFVGESPFPAQSAAQNAGKLTVVPGSLGHFFLSLAVQQGSALRDKLSTAILQLAESGALATLLNKYGLA